MKLSTYHLHTTFCDGKNTPEEMVLEAIKLGCTEIGFSGHSHLPFEPTWTMKKEDVPVYVQTIKDLKEKYKDKIKIYIGIEQDYFSEAPDWKPDYILGAVHCIYKNGEYFDVDTSAEVMKKNVDKHYGGDVYAYCEDYFALMADLYNKTKCDIIAHFDLVTKFNEVMPIIDVTHPRYVKASNDALEALLKTPAVFEVNTGAISRGYRTEPYPEDSLLDKIAQSGKPLVVNSDTHNTGTLAFLIGETKEKLDKKGYKYIDSLDEIL